MTRARATSCRQRKAGRSRGELLAHGAVVLLGVQGAVLADGVAQQQVERAAPVVAQLAVAVHHGAGPGLVLARGSPPSSSLSSASASVAVTVLEVLGVAGAASIPGSRRPG